MTDHFMAALAVANRSDGFRARLKRLGEYGLVGASGVPVDMAVVTVVVGLGQHYLAAQVAGWLIAMSWNFGLNWWVTFDRPDGSLLRQYVSYAGVQGGALAARVGIVALLVEWLAAPVLVSSLIGIMLPAVAAFLLCERAVFEVVTDG